jgi:hypothetical protein
LNEQLEKALKANAELDSKLKAVQVELDQLRGEKPKPDTRKAAKRPREAEKSGKFSLFAGKFS